MAATPTHQIPLGFRAPDFELPDTIGSLAWSPEDLVGPKGLLVVFICNHCPYVIHILPKLVDLCTEWQDLGLGIVFISSNDVEKYPQDSPDKMKDLASEYGFDWPYLFDASQETAKAYFAACTPDFMLFDDALACVYRGQFDDARPKNEAAVTGADLAQAVEHLLEGSEIPSEQKPSIGCNIKWKPGNAPEYFG